MEDVLDVYQRPLDPKRPLVCMDEGSKQLLDDSRPPEPMQPQQGEHTAHALREDYEYVREGTCSFFMIFAPLLCFRHVGVTQRRTAVDFAGVVKDLVDLYFPDADKIVLVLDNLNTHTAASLYEAFEPAEAKRLADKLEIHYTPKHGSWLNMAEIELSVLGRQCLDRRLPDVEVLSDEILAWEQARNAAMRTVHWRFTTADARIKLKKLYPVILP
jgi:DDE superfamily endonuclease